MINNSSKTYDVIIMTYMPKDYLTKSIEMLMNMKCLPSKIIICNTDEELFYKNIKDKPAIDALLNKKSDVEIQLIHVNKEDFDHGKTRNYAVTFTNSDYILFLTDDAVPYDENMTDSLIDAFDKYSTESSKVAVSYARQIPRDNATLKEKLIREYNYPAYDIIKEKSKEKELGIKNYFCSNVCAMYDRDIFIKQGMFEENIILNEDTFYVYNAINNGYRVVYKSDALVIHSHNLRYIDQFRRNFDIGVSQEERKEIFDRVPSEKEGVGFVKAITIKLLKGFHFVTLIDFSLDCAYRYFGYKMGRRYMSLDTDKRIKYSNNKYYFKGKND